MADDELYLENLKEFVVEEEKIVTYKWLSQTLSVNVNQAKQMLFAFVQQQQKNDSLSVVYLVGGIIKNDNGNLFQKYLLAHEKDLQDIKQCFDQLTSLHIYSVQKSNPKDSNVLYVADYDLQKQNLECPNRWSNISCKLAAKRSSEVHETRDNNDKENVDTERPKSNGLHIPFKQESRAQPNFGGLKSTKNAKSKVKSTVKKGDVASFFARHASNNKEKPNKENINNRIENSRKNDPKTNAQADHDEKQTKHDVKDNEEVVEKEEEVCNEADNLKTQSFKEDKVDPETIENSEDDKEMNKGSSDEVDTKTSSPNEAEKKTKQTAKQKQKKDETAEKKVVKRSKTKKSTKEEAESTQEDHEGSKQRRRKRKRVKEFSDSSSEGEAEPVSLKKRQQSDSSADSTSIPDQQPQLTITKTEPAQKVRRRKRVLKSKTYLDDEGYMVTEKVYESESTDGSDVEKEDSKVPDKETVTKPAEKNTRVSPKKPVHKATKQSSLTSFFKRS